MATPNYAFEKRKRELAKKQKQQEKQQQKLASQAEQKRDATEIAQSDELKTKDK